MQATKAFIVNIQKKITQLNGNLKDKAFILWGEKDHLLTDLQNNLDNLFNPYIQEYEHIPNQNENINENINHSNDEMVGHVLNGTFHGQCRVTRYKRLATLQKLQITIYEGHFVNNALNGKGSITIAVTDQQKKNIYRKTTYEGHFVNNALNGVCTITHQNIERCVYIGKCNNGYVASEFTIKYQDGSVYRGGVRKQAEDQMSLFVPHGEGTLQDQHGDIYQGTWDHDVRNGIFRLQQGGNEFFLFYDNDGKLTNKRLILDTSDKKKQIKIIEKAFGKNKNGNFVQSYTSGSYETQYALQRDCMIGTIDNLNFWNTHQYSSIKNLFGLDIQYMNNIIYNILLRINLSEETDGYQKAVRDIQLINNSIYLIYTPIGPCIMIKCPNISDQPYSGILLIDCNSLDDLKQSNYVPKNFPQTSFMYCKAKGYATSCINVAIFIQSLRKMFMNSAVKEIANEHIDINEWLSIGKKIDDISIQELNQHLYQKCGQSMLKLMQEKLISYGQDKTKCMNLVNEYYNSMQHSETWRKENLNTTIKIKDKIHENHIFRLIINYLKKLKIKHQYIQN